MLVLLNESTSDIPQNQILNSKNFKLKSDIYNNSNGELKRGETKQSPVQNYYLNSLNALFAKGEKLSNRRSKNYQLKETNSRESKEDYDDDDENKSNNEREFCYNNNNNIQPPNGYNHFKEISFLLNDCNKENVSIIVNETNNYYNYNTVLKNNNNINQNEVDYDNNNNNKSILNSNTPIFNPNALTLYSDESLVKLSIFLIKEQNGSRYLQKKLKSDSRFSNSVFFPYLSQNISQQTLIDLICDKFGNYLFQTLVECLTHINLSHLMLLISNVLYSICIDNYGTRVIQKLISVIKKNSILLDQLISMLQPLILQLLEESHGNHIVQQFIDEIKDESKTQFIYNIIYSHFVPIAENKFGCCTIQKLLIKSSYKDKDLLLNLIKRNILPIISTQYGSYIFQCVIENESIETKLIVLNEILPHLIEICKIKYSSNAIEKCFEFKCQVVHDIIIKTICERDCNIKELIMDPYGNYIIQKALCVCEENYYMKIITVIARSAEEIKKLPFGYKLILKLLIQHKKLGEIIINNGNTIKK